MTATAEKLEENGPPDERSALDVSVSFHSEKVDDRRNKTYGRKLHVRAIFKVPDEKPEHYRRAGSLHRESLSTYVTRHTHAAVQGHKDAEDAPRLKYDSFGSYSSQGAWDPCETFSYKTFFKSEKPSLILDEDECVRALGGEAKLRQLFEDSIVAGLAEGRAEHALEEQAHFASCVLGHYGKVVEEKAIKATRYKQRLAALTAELQAEYVEQARAMLSEMGDGYGWTPDEDDDPVDMVAVEAAKSRLIEYVKGTTVPHDRGFSRSNAKEPITADDLREGDNNKDE